MTTKANPQPAKKAATHRMIVGRQPISEGGEIHQPGATVEIPTDRVKALGKLVSPAPKEEKAKE